MPVSSHARIKHTPQRVVLFAQTAGLDEPQPFLSRLAGLVKYDVAARAGRCRVSELAAVLGHREGTVRKGITWLVARGQVAVVSEDEEGLTLALGDRQQRGNADLIYRELQALLAETAAYRGHFRRAEAQTLMPHG